MTTVVTEDVHGWATVSPLLELHDVVKHFPAGSGKTVHSVDGVDLAVRKGEVLGLVGESGCGKSTLARTILRAVAASSGQIVFDGRDITRAKGKELKALRRSMQFVFQDPYGAFDPKMSLGSQPGSAAAPPRHEESRGTARTDAGHARPRRARGGQSWSAARVSARAGSCSGWSSPARSCSSRDS